MPMLLSPEEPGFLLKDAGADLLPAGVRAANGDALISPSPASTCSTAYRGIAARNRARQPPQRTGDQIAARGCGADEQEICAELSSHSAQ